mmetsp:Transcript_166196/g.403777  ORF Transcript_166196/g.403777 Transcript_166196/m.403777 type:complete len:436 (-) Transcript_166196:65-1372(-)
MKVAIATLIAVLMQEHRALALRQPVKELMPAAASNTSECGDNPRTPTLANVVRSTAERNGAYVARINGQPLSWQWAWGNPHPNVDRALACLRKTKPNLSLVYPADAEQHVNEIRDAMKPWNSIPSTYHAEDIWMDNFLSRWESRAPGTRVSDIFGNYIPIFTRWVEPWFTSGMHYPEGFLEALQKVLRGNVPYVTVSQNDEGITGKYEVDMNSVPNILVLSAGGYGHVAVPLLHTNAGSQSEAKQNAYAGFFSYQQHRVPLKERRYLFSYVGSLIHAPHDMRARMKKTVEDFAQAHNIMDKVLVPTEKTEGWKDIMLSSRFSLVPRGFGRTSYHLAEALQMGVIPIHVYIDQPWIPYPRAYEKLGLATTVEGLPAVMERLMRLSDAEVEQLEARVVKFAESHYSLQGMTKQIASFLAGGSSDLVCQRLPSSVTGE